MLERPRRAGSVLAMVMLIGWQAIAAIAGEVPADGPTATPSPRLGIAALDCGKATKALDKVVCGDTALAELDRALAAAYTRAMGQWPDNERAEQREAQRTWNSDRDSCQRAKNPKPCLQWLYQHRLAEVRIQGGELAASKPVRYLCEGHANTPLSVAFYDQTDPKSALVTFGERRLVALSSPSESGPRYTSNDFVFEDHNGEVTLVSSGDTYVCKAH